MGELTYNQIYGGNTATTPHNSSPGKGSTLSLLSSPLSPPRESARAQENLSLPLMSSPLLRDTQLRSPSLSGSFTPVSPGAVSPGASPQQGVSQRPTGSSHMQQEPGQQPLAASCPESAELLQSPVSSQGVQEEQMQEPRSDAKQYKVHQDNDDVVSELHDSPQHDSLQPEEHAAQQYRQQHDSPQYRGQQQSQQQYADQTDMLLSGGTAPLQERLASAGTEKLLVWLPLESIQLPGSDRVDIGKDWC